MQTHHDGDNKTVNTAMINSKPESARTNISIENIFSDSKVEETED